MISVTAENEAVWFSVVTLSCVVAFVSAPVLPAQAGVCLAAGLGMGTCISQQMLALTKMDAGNTVWLENGKRWASCWLWCSVG